MSSNEVIFDWRRPGYNRSAAMTRVNRERATQRPVLPFRRAGDPQHGTTTAYQRGCGCNLCRRANMLAQRAKRA